MTDPRRDEASESGARAVERAALALERMAAAFERMAASLERTPVASPPPSAADERTQLLRSIRRSIREGEWDEAEAQVREFVGAHPDDPEGARAGDDLAAARQAAGRGLLAELDAARAANDPVRALELRDAATPLVTADASSALDRDLARWCMALIQKRLRGGVMSPDVATLAARVAESLGATPEGASLRSALPTLRRSAGLCARCGAPYTGVADACPKCLAAPSPAASEANLPADSPNGQPVDDEADAVPDVADLPEDDIESFRDETDPP